MNKNPIAKTRNFVQTHKTAIAASLGVIAGASLTYYTCISGRTLIEVTAAHVDHMRENELAFLYDTAHGAVMLTVPKHP